MTCDECKRRAHTRLCESHATKGSRICKDCCIAKMKGHSCRWFQVCW